MVQTFGTVDDFESLIANTCGNWQVGKLADLVLWQPGLFGAKPEIVIKGGFIAWAQMGDANASIPTPEPVSMHFWLGAILSRACNLFFSENISNLSVFFLYEKLSKEMTRLFFTKCIVKFISSCKYGMPALQIIGKFSLCIGGYEADVWIPW